MRATPSSASRGTESPGRNSTLSGTGSASASRAISASSLTPGTKIPSAPASTYAGRARGSTSTPSAAQPVGVDARVDEGPAAGDGDEHLREVRRVGELVLEVDAGDRPEPVDVGRHLGGIGREAVLDVDRHRHRKVGETAGEVDRRLRGLRRAIGPAERGGDAEAGRARPPGSRRRRARRPRRGPTRSAATEPGRCRSANALIGCPRRARAHAPLRGSGAARRRRGGRRGRRGQSRRRDRHGGWRARADHPPGRARPSPRTPGRGSRRARGDEFRLAASQQVEQLRQRRVGAGCDVCGW